ncbi:hypothetical protein NU10_11365 [Flavobacterium dauae]|uniref:hypothetical protein n=1 Tax=Flavobacterium dauae TaxID=1563479 RepID=UPI00101B48BC|nr:hypothetical protein [Flavobacterium dauae]WLD23301.1 hypothetical protein NU10_11365 [Flavobacterium dauae]
MKKLCLFLTLAVISIGCEGEVVHYPDDDCVDWQIQVEIGQMVRLVNEEDDWSEQIDFENLRLFATDTDWNIMVNSNGEPLQEIPNGIEAKKIYDQNGIISYIHLFLGQIQQQKDIDEKKCYFLLKINENTYHQIAAEYYTDCGDFILTKFHYNGTEYTASDWEIIDIVVD